MTIETMSTVRIRAGTWGTALTLALAFLIIAGSRNLAHFDAALVAYTFATIFATFSITYRYALCLVRIWRSPPACGWR